MTDTVKLFLENVAFLTGRVEEHSKALKSLYNILLNHPEGAFNLISERDKFLLFSSFIELDKVVRGIKAVEIEALLKRLTATLYGGDLDKLRRKK